MMRFISLVILLATILCSCAKKITNTDKPTDHTKSNKVSTQTNPAKAEPGRLPVDTAIVHKPVAALETENNKQYLAAGKQVFEAKCASCHELRTPENYIAEKWVKIIDWMAPKANLNTAEKENVLAYVRFYAKK